MSKQIKYVNGDMYEYELYPIVDQYDTVLNSKPDPFFFEDDGANSRTPVIPKNLAISLLETMKGKYGVGLAANQVEHSSTCIRNGCRQVMVRFL